MTCVQKKHLKSIGFFRFLNGRTQRAFSILKLNQLFEERKAMHSSALPRVPPSSTRLRGVQRSTMRSFPADRRNGRSAGVMVAAAAVTDVDVCIVGGGPAGLAAALAIERAAPGTRVAVLERARSLKPVGFTIGLMVLFSLTAWSR